MKVRKGWQWLRANRDIFTDWDFRLAAYVSGITLLVAIFSDDLRARAIPLFAAEAALGVALLAVALTALAILVGLLNDHYVQILDTEGGLEDAFQPYKITAFIGGMTTLASLIVMAGWHIDVFPSGVAIFLRSFGMAVTAGGTVWAVAGTIQLVDDTAFHGVQRGQLIRGIQEARQLASRTNKAV